MPVYHDATPDAIADGLRRNGHQVTGPDGSGQYRTSTALCHNGDSPDKLTFRPDGNGGTVAGCWTGDCGAGTDGQRELLRKLRIAAGIQARRGRPPKAAGVIPDWRHIATYTGDGLPDKAVYRRDWEGACDSSKCKAVGAHKHISQSKGRMDGYALLPWPAGAAVQDTLVIAEGEKAAAALGDVLRGYTPVSWIGGAQNAGKADYSLASGRAVYLWPDNDSEGLAAMETAARMCVDAGAVRLMMVPVDHLPDKADAADLPADERAITLQLATEYTPEIENPIDIIAFHKVNFTPVADAIKLLELYADILLITEDKAAETTDVLILNEVGIWQKDNAELQAMVLRTYHTWYVENADADQKRADRRRETIGSARALREVIDAIPAAYRLLLAAGSVPAGLRCCEAKNLDSALDFIGTKSGVLHLPTGIVLSASGGAGKFITRSIPDEYDPDADSYPDAQQLLAHLPDENKQFLLEAIAFALRGRVSRRIYLLPGPPASGKTTFLAAVGAALGNAKSGGYHAQLSSNALVKSTFSTKNGHTEDIVDLQYARIASKSEMPSDSSLDIPLLKELSGGGEQTFREIYKRAHTAGTVTATVVIACNLEDARNIDVSDDAFADRLKILPYSPIYDGIKGVEYLDRMQNDAAARMGVMAMIVKAGIGKEYPPDDIESIQTAMDKQKRESLDEVGQWIIDSIDITGGRFDVITTAEFWARLASEFDVPAESREVHGYNQRGLIALAKQLMPAFPSSKSMHIQGRTQRAYVGVRWVESESEGRHDE